MLFALAGHGKITGLHGDACLNDFALHDFSKKWRVLFLFGANEVPGLLADTCSVIVPIAFVL